MVHDHFNPLIPHVPITPWIQPAPWPAPETPPFPHTRTVTVNDVKVSVDLAALAQLLKEYREALEAAKKVDVLTGQPDCVDPQKAKLEDRVAELEKLVAGLTKPKRRAKKKAKKRR